MKKEGREGEGKGRRKGKGRGKEKRGKKAEESPLLDYSCGCSKQNKGFVYFTF